MRRGEACGERSLTGSLTFCACRMTEEEIETTYEADMARAKQRKEKGILSPDSYKEEKEEAWQIRREMILRVRSASSRCACFFNVSTSHCLLHRVPLNRPRCRHGSATSSSPKMQRCLRSRPRLFVVLTRVRRSSKVSPRREWRQLPTALQVLLRVCPRCPQRSQQAMTQPLTSQQ